MFTDTISLKLSIYWRFEVDPYYSNKRSMTSQKIHHLTNLKNLLLFLPYEKQDFFPQPKTSIL